MPVRAWIRDHSAEGQVARRVEALLGLEPDEVVRTARIEQPGRLGHLGSRLTGPLGRFGLRLDPGRRAAAAVGAAALVAVLVAGCWVLVNRPHAVALSAPSPDGSVSASAAASASDSARESSTSTSAPTSAAASASTSGSAIVVDVVGKVVQPGVYRLPPGSRITDAVQAAGGALPGVDLATLNLAQVLSDGQQVAVDVPGAPVVAGNSGGTASTNGPVNLNSATAAQLDALPGVGPVLAQHILDWRNSHGRFASVDQLREVSGIGEAKFADLRPLVTV